MAMSDAELRRRFEAVVGEVVEPVRRYLYRRTDRDTADDVLSSTLLVLWRRTADVPEDAVPWAIGVARLQLTNEIRASRRQHRLVSRIITVDPPRETVVDDVGQVRDAVRETLQALRQGDAEVLQLWAWEGLAPTQIADVLGVSVNAATVRLHRARKRFAVQWGKDHPDSGHVEVKEGSNR